MDIIIFAEVIDRDSLTKYVMRKKHSTQHQLSPGVQSGSFFIKDGDKITAIIDKQILNIENDSLEVYCSCENTMEVFSERKWELLKEETLPPIMSKPAYVRNPAILQRIGYDEF